MCPIAQSAFTVHSASTHSPDEQASPALQSPLYEQAVQLPSMQACPGQSADVAHSRRRHPGAANAAPSAQSASVQRTRTAREIVCDIIASEREREARLA